MHWRKAILISLLIGLIAIQFLQPARNSSLDAAKADISTIYEIPGNIHRLIKETCYDCHSNQTRYPWYSRIQPYAWFMASHIRKGKSELNFHEFGNYSTRRQISKLNGIINSIKDGSMPLWSYKLFHSEAVLSDSEKQLIMGWATATMDSLRSLNKQK